MIKIEALIRPQKLEEVKAALAEIGDGKIFLIRIRTGEEGETAIE